MQSIQARSSLVVQKFHGHASLGYNTSWLRTASIPWHKTLGNMEVTIKIGDMECSVLAEGGVAIRGHDRQAMKNAWTTLATFMDNHMGYNVGTRPPLTIHYTLCTAQLGYRVSHPLRSLIPWPSIPSQDPTYPPNQLIGLANVEFFNDGFVMAFFRHEATNQEVDNVWHLLTSVLDPLQQTLVQ